MKIKINTKRLTSLKPCQYRLDNWIKHYADFDGDITKFLRLKHITHSDKIWVATRLIPLEMRAVFALDCSFAATLATVNDDYVAYAAAVAAYSAAYAAYSADADDAANAAANAAYSADADDAAEKERQIESLIYLIKGE